MPPDSGVGVLDKTSLLFAVLARGPASLRALSEATGLSRATVYRLALALERLRLLSRDAGGRFLLGPRLGELAVESCRDRLLQGAEHELADLRVRTGASARLYRRHGGQRICVATAEGPGTGRPARSAEGVALPMKAGAGAQVLLAWEEPEEITRSIRGAGFGAVTLTRVRQQGWAQSLGVGELGFGAAAVPVRGVAGRVVAALVLDGPITLMSRSPGRRYGGLLIDAAARLGAVLT
ncbi:helix-turn-helix domain-containing protein [Kitasatospora sp. NA04385]|uniref:IclR family transcriptional regulator n=1 Tax=Kitasatospora sp. NA04385 TaxID=2742135 RepID=UPI0015923C64|nr:IclR family transcriptional regulator C-terminal domain-containing protein [Kitasatospora sp. NA04385]QKW24525.1 helix-turn-helix domain-containing protein [Kitasatospora sp. NA04385]